MMSLTGIMVILLVYPIFSYIKTPVKWVDIQEETRNSKGIEWAFSHYKIKDSKDLRYKGKNIPFTDYNIVLYQTKKTRTLQFV